MALSTLRGDTLSSRQLLPMVRKGFTQQPVIAAAVMAAAFGVAVSTAALAGSYVSYAATTSSTCVSPVFTTSSADEGKNIGGYYVHNNMWNAGGYNVTQKLEACSAQKWNVTVTADNAKGDGAVKTYPNVHKDYHNWSTGAEPRLDSYTKITSTFGATAPRTSGQIYNVAYDIWLNGVPGNREIMIWTENWNQRPAGNKIGNVQIASQTWEFWATGNNHILTFVAPQPMTSGILDIKAFLDWLNNEKRIPADSTLGQIDYGVEVVSTGGQPATFNFTDFTISDSTSPAAGNQDAAPAPAPAVTDDSTANDEDEEQVLGATEKDPNELPSTGPEAIIGSVVGLGALAYGIFSYARSRSILRSLFHR